MGKIGRIACILTPMALTLASFICILLLFLGGLNKNSDTLSSIYFMKADLSNFTATPATSVASSKVLQGVFSTARTSGILKDVYTVGLWNYCSGDLASNNGTSTTNITYCSPRQAEYWFDPVTVWGLNGTGVQTLFPKEWQTGLNTYKTVAEWTFVAWSVALGATLIAFLVGFLAIFSRWGSFVTSIISSTSTAFTLAAAIASTALYSTLVGTLDTTLHPYNINLSLSTHTLSIIWLAAAFSIAATVAWLISTCCCSGRSDRSEKTGRGRKTDKVEKTPYTYERVASPYMGAGAPGVENGYGAYLGAGQGKTQGKEGSVRMWDLESRRSGREEGFEPYRRVGEV